MPSVIMSTDEARYAYISNWRTLQNRPDVLTAATASTTNGKIKILKQDSANVDSNYEVVVYTHPTTDGNKHVPETSTTHNGHVLVAGSSAGSFAWKSLADANIVTTNTTQTISGTKTFSSTITGTRAIFTSTTDAASAQVNAVALILGDSTATHLELDNNEIIAKTGAATVGNLYLNENAYITASGGFYTSGGTITTAYHSIYAGTDGDTTREINVRCCSGAGTIYLYSVASETGNRGIYVPAHGTGAAKNVILVDTNNNVTFNGSLSGNAATASSAAKLTTARTLTIGGTGKTFDGSGNVSWSKAEILGSSTNANFYRGDQTWSNTLNGAFTANGTITANGGYLKSTANSNTVTIGSQNASFTHIYNSASIPFIFNNTVETTTGNLGTTSYPWNNLYIGKANGAGIYYTGSQATYRMIRFLDNASDGNGNGIIIGGGGQTIIGGGESANTAAAQASTNGAEIMQVCNDGNVEFISNLQNGWDSRHTMTLNTSGYLMLPSYINVPTGNNENPTVSQFIVTNGSDNYYRKASAAHAMAAIRSNASGSWGISITGSSASCTGNAATATKATQDGSGATITSTYLKLAGGTMTGTITTVASGSAMNWRAPSNITCSATANGQEWSFDLSPGSYTGTYWHVWSGTNSATILQCFNDNRHVAIPVHLYVGGYNNTSYALSTASFICNSWIRTVGSTGWYNETHGGGWYMTDDTWIRSYNNRSVYVNTGELRCDGSTWGGKLRMTDNWLGFYSANGNSGTRYGYIQCNADRMYFRKENSTSGLSYYFDFGSTVQAPTFRAGNDAATYTTATCKVYAANGTISIHSSTNRGVYEHTDGKWIIYLQHSDDTVHSGYKIYDAVWNDFAEMREGDIIDGGYAVYDDGHGKMKLCTERMQPGSRITSDTFGIVVGCSETAKTPIGVAGRVLVYPAQPRENYHVGDAVCAAPEGKLDLMTRKEIMAYPDRILGIVSEIPDYEIWNQRHKAEEEEQYTETNIPVNGRIWIYVR